MSPRDAPAGAAPWPGRARGQEPVRGRGPALGRTVLAAGLVAAAVVTGALAAAVVGPAWAVPAAPAPEVDAGLGPGGADVGARAPGDGGPVDGGASSQGGAGGSSPGGATRADGGAAAGGGGGGGGPAYAYTRVADCEANAPGVEVGVLCNAATLSCPQPQIRFRFFRRPAAEPDAPWEPTGVRCQDPAEPAGPAAGDAAPVVITVGVEEFASLPFAPGTSLLQPPGGQVLVNLPVHVHADAAVQVLPTVVLGVPVSVRATPTAYAWDLGDGTAIGPVPAQPVLVRTARSSLVADLVG